MPPSATSAATSPSATVPATSASTAATASAARNEQSIENRKRQDGPLGPSCLFWWSCEGGRVKVADHPLVRKDLQPRLASEHVIGTQLHFVAAGFDRQDRRKIIQGYL